MQDIFEKVLEESECLVFTRIHGSKISIHRSVALVTLGENVRSTEAPGVGVSCRERGRENITSNIMYNWIKYKNWEKSCTARWKNRSRRWKKWNRRWKNRSRRWMNQSRRWKNQSRQWKNQSRRPRSLVWPGEHKECYLENVKKKYNTWCIKLWFHTYTPESGVLYDVGYIFWHVHKRWMKRTL